MLSGNRAGFFSEATAASSSSPPQPNVPANKVLITDNGHRYELIYRVTHHEMDNILEDLPNMIPYNITQYTPGNIKPIRIQLGRGRFSIARLARRLFDDGTYKYYAVRKIRSFEDPTHSGHREAIINSTLRELELQQKMREIINCDHFSIAEDVVIKPNSRHETQIYQFIPLADLGTGENFLGRVKTIALSDTQKATILTYISNIIISEVNTLNKNGFYILDIKIENMLFSSKGDVWLSDFGSAAYHGADGTELHASTLSHAQYMPPFNLFHGNNQLACNRLHDQWGLGLALLQVWSDADINKSCKELFDLSLEYKKYIDAFKKDHSASPDNLLTQYQTAMTKLAQLPSFQNIPEHIRMIILDTLDMNIRTRKKNLAEMVDHHASSLHMSDSAIAEARLLFDIAQSSPLAKSIRSQSSGNLRRNPFSFYYNSYDAEFIDSATASLPRSSPSMESARRTPCPIPSRQ